MGLNCSLLTEFQGDFLSKFIYFRSTGLAMALFFIYPQCRPTFLFRVCATGYISKRVGHRVPVVGFLVSFIK